MLVWIALFAASAIVIGVAGWTLVAAADVIAERTRMGRAFMGMILVATITSLPELSTGVGAITLANSPDIAVGTLVGSCAFNLLLFAFADAASPGIAFYGRLRSAHNLTAAFGAMLLGLLAIALLVPGAARVTLGHMGAYTLLIAVLYFTGARLLHAVEISTAPDVEEAPGEITMSLRAAIVRCVASGGAVVIGGLLVAVSADRIAEATPLSDSLVGVLMVAVATSLPEIVTVWAAIRLSAYDLAAGNILGSNLFNMVLLAVYDLAYLEGPLLAAASATLAAPTIVAIVMTMVIVAALNYVRRTRPNAVDAWASFSLVGLYVFNAWLLFSQMDAPG